MASMSDFMRSWCQNYCQGLGFPSPNRLMAPISITQFVYLKPAGLTRIDSQYSNADIDRYSIQLNPQFSHGFSPMVLREQLSITATVRRN